MMKIRRLFHPIGQGAFLLRNFLVENENKL